MRIEYNVDVKHMPTQMMRELSIAPHAGEAEKIFNKWADVFYVPIKERSHVWLNT